MLLKVSVEKTNVGVTVAALAEATGDQVNMVGTSKALALAEAAVVVTTRGRGTVLALAEAGAGVTDLTTYVINAEIPGVI